MITKHAEPTSQRPQRRLGRVVASVAAMATAAVVGLAPPSLADAPGTVGDTGGVGLNVRATPSTGGAALHNLDSGTQVSIDCQIRGDWVTNESGFSSNLWDSLPAYGGYVADAYVDTGYDGPIPGVPTCDEAEPPPGGDLTYVTQLQGHSTQGEDCGPTSAIMALLADGTTPRAWSQGEQAAVIQAHADSEIDWIGPSTQGVLNVLEANGRSGALVGSADAVLGHVRDGGTGILGGTTEYGVPWANSAGQGAGHFMAILDYDAGSGLFAVGDPSSINQYVQYATWNQLSEFFYAVSGKGGVILS